MASRRAPSFRVVNVEKAASIAKIGLGHKLSAFPLIEAHAHEDHVDVPYDKAIVNKAPNVASIENLTEDEKLDLRGHYHLAEGTATSATARDSPTFADREAERTQGGGVDAEAVDTDGH